MGARPSHGADPGMSLDSAVPLRGDWGGVLLTAEADRMGLTVRAKSSQRSKSVGRLIIGCSGRRFAGQQNKHATAALHRPGLHGRNFAVPEIDVAARGAENGTSGVLGNKEVAEFL